MNAIFRFFQQRVWSALPAEVSDKDRRTAGIAWPIALAAFAALIAWRRHRRGDPAGLAPYILIVMAPLLGASLLAGAALGARVYRGVMLFFLTFGFFVSHALLIVFFYVFIAPFALLLRLLGKDLLDKRGWKRPQWTPHAPSPERRRFYRQF
jgi:hypothetical protein